MNLNELPGSEIILPGLSDLHRGKSNTIGALLAAIAATRLTEAGLDIPKDNLAPEPNGTKKSSKLCGIRTTAFKAIEQCRDGSGNCL
jgi:hypothetical protein